MSTLVSVIIPCYNLNKYILTCLESVEQLKHSNLEVIIVDDGSKDDSVQIIRDFIAKVQGSTSKRYIFIQQENTGAAAARNTGLNAATGEYIAFIDGDDWVDSLYITKMLEAIQKDRYDLCISGVHDVYENETKDFRIADMTLSGNENCCQIAKYGYHFVYLYGKLYLSSILKSKKIALDESMIVGEDFTFNLDYFQHINSCICINECLYYYRINQGSLSHKITVPSLYKNGFTHCNAFFGNLDRDKLACYFENNIDFIFFFWNYCVRNPVLGELMTGNIQKAKMILKEDFVGLILRNYHPEDLLNRIWYFLIKNRLFLVARIFLYFQYSILLKCKPLYNGVKALFH